MRVSPQSTTEWARQANGATPDSGIHSGRYLAHCRVCGHGAPQRRYRFEEFEILRCPACATAWRSQMYTPDQVKAMYQEETYEDHPYFSYDPGAGALERVPRFQSFERGLRVLESRTGVGRLLDVGCGAGIFMAIAQSRGWDVHGVEPCTPLCDLTTRNVGPNRVANAAFEDVEGVEGGYDAVAMWDVLEHVLDPLAWVVKARALLRPGGVLVVCTPDEESLLAGIGRVLYRLTRGSYDYPALALHPGYHTFFFSGSGLAKLFGAGGLTLTDSYSQEAFAAHSPFANRVEKLVIAAIERVAGLRDARYERVAFAQA